MPIITKLKIVLGADTSQALADLSASSKLLGDIEANANRAQKALDSIKPPASMGANQGGASGFDAGMVGAQLGGSITSAMAPIATVMTKLGGQFNQLGGTVTTLARRIDDTFKSQRLDAFLGVVDKKLPNAFVKLGTNAVRVVTGIQSHFTHAGDVAKKSLDQLEHRRFAGPIAGARQLGSTFTAGVVPTIQAGTSGIKAFGREALVALGVFGLGFKVVQFFRTGIKGAIDLAETVSKTQEVFKSTTTTVTSQAEKMARAYGLPKQALLDGASSIGLVAKASGQTDAEAAKLANTMVRLAADASSLQNVPLSESLDKIRSGLVGESEPLRAFGVLMSESAVKAEALRMGLMRGKKELDERAKVAARASLIERGLATASGDLDRTLGGAANQFRKAGGGIQNFAVSLGTAFLPAVTTGITIFNEFASTVIETVEANKGIIEGFASGVQFAFEMTGIVVRNFGSILQIISLKAQEMALNFVAVVQTIPENLNIIGTWIGTNWTKIIADAVNLVGSLFGNLGKNIGEFAHAVWEFLSDPTKGFTFNFTPLLDGFKATAEALPELVKPGLISMQAEIDAVAQKIGDREAARAASLQKFAKGSAPKIGTETAKDSSDQKAPNAALQLGSKEAYSAIAAHRNGGRGGDAAKSTADNTKTIAERQSETNRHLGTIAAKLGVQGLNPAGETVLF